MLIDGLPLEAPAAPPAAAFELDGDDVFLPGSSMSHLKKMAEDHLHPHAREGDLG